MSRFSRTVVWTGAVLSTLTGLVYWWMVHMMTPVSEWAAINHPLQPWVLKAHIVTAPVLVYAGGLITVEHVWPRFRSAVRSGRRTGLAMAGVFVPMIVSGYLIQTMTVEPWLGRVAWLHLVTGLVFVVGLGVHQVAVGTRPLVRERRARGGHESC